MAVLRTALQLQVVYEGATLHLFLLSTSYIICIVLPTTYYYYYYYYESVSPILRGYKRSAWSGSGNIHNIHLSVVQCTVTVQYSAVSCQ